MLEELLVQAAKAAAYYPALVVLMRVAGKRLAGQTTTFDLYGCLIREACGAR